MENVTGGWFVVTDVTTMSIGETASTVPSGDTSQPQNNFWQPSKKQIQCDNYKFAVSVIFMGFLCIFGMAGNLLSLAVLARLRKISRDSASPAVLLTALSVSDFLVLASFLLLKVSPSLCAYRALCYEYFDTYLWIAMYGWPTLTVFHTLATWLTVLLTIHRYIAVCHPLKALSWGRITKIRLHIILVTLASVLYNIPGYLDYRPVATVNQWNQTVYTRELTAVGQNYWYQVLYKTASYFIFIYLIPVMVLLVLGALLIRSLAKADTFRSEKASSGSEDKKGQRSAKDDMTRIMIFIVVVHLLTQPWEPVRRFLSEKLSLDPSCGHFLFYFDEIPSLLAVLNSAVNFVVYCVVGSRFRKVCRDLFGCTRKDEIYEGSTSGGISAKTDDQGM